MKRWPLFSISVASFVLVVVRMIWPTLRIDNTSLILVGIATLSLLVALLPIKRIKWGEFEAELDRALDVADRKLEATEVVQPAKVAIGANHVELTQSQKDAEAFVERFLPEETRKTFDEYIGLVNSPVSDLEKIVAATVLLDKVLAKAMAKSGDDAKQFRTSRTAINQLVKAGALTKDEGDAFTDVWKLRTKIIHEGMKPTGEQTARFLDILWRLILKLA
jgi:hypothetical protein